jgi:hypothetical protein
MLAMAVAAVIISKRSYLEKTEETCSKISYNPAETKFLEKATGQEALEWAKSRTSKAQDDIRKHPVYASIKTNIENIFYNLSKDILQKIENNNNIINPNNGIKLSLPYNTNNNSICCYT